MQKRLKNVPLLPGVYIYKDKEGKVIYVGKAKILRNRMRSYFQSPESMHPKVRAMMKKVSDFDYIITSSEVEALILENNLIKSYQPRYNIMLRDDKTYPYLKISVGEDFPRISIVREKKDQISRYFGPYTGVGSLRETLKLLTGIFPLRSCKSMKNKSRPCLNYDLNKCLAPCMGQVTKEEYAGIVKGLLDFLEGKSHDLLKKKEKEMKNASAKLEFEKAARLRDQINAIKILGEKQQIDMEHAYEMDIIGMISGEKENLLLVFKVRRGIISAKDTFWLKRAMNEDEHEMLGFFIKQYYADKNDIPPEILLNMVPADEEILADWLKEKSEHKVKLKVPERGEKKSLMTMVVENAALLWEEKKQEDIKAYKLLLHLSEVLRLEILPERIECYDISHLGGEETVASMVVFTGGKADKKSYRRFKIKNEQNNDFASLSETLRRRFTEAQKGNEAFLPEPDLLLIDGGLGQVNSVKMVLDEMNVDIAVFGLAKKNEEIYRPGCGVPLVLSKRDEGLMLLQRLRDEAHRFAITYNRQRRGEKIRKSVLDEIDGIGPNRKKTLLQYFSSVAKIKEASLEELIQVPGMNKTVAENVYNYFQSK